MGGGSPENRLPAQIKQDPCTARTQYSCNFFETFRDFAGSHPRGKSDKACTVNGALPSLRFLTRIYARRPSLTACRDNCTVSCRICGNASTILVYGSARFFAASYDSFKGVRSRSTVKAAVNQIGRAHV